MEVVSIQYLRGCAALMVVLFHLALQLHRVGYQGYWPQFFDAGVDIFFVISGFIMWITTAKGMTTLEFYRRRILRIVPLGDAPDFVEVGEAGIAVDECYASSASCSTRWVTYLDR